MDTEQPYYDDDESDFQSDDSDGFEFDDTDDADSVESTETDESVSQSETSLIDLVAGEQAAEFKQQVYQSLYAKVGEKLDAMKADTRQSAIPDEPE